MKAKRKLCVGCDKEQFIWKSEGRYKYCKNCWLAKVPTKPLNRTPIKASQKPMRKKSSKMAALDTVYKALRKTYMDKYPLCCARLDCCTNSSTDIHHKKGRGPYHNDPTTWLSVCRSCHMWIEEHPKESIALGYSIKRN
mgnify:FL=1